MCLGVFVENESNSQPDGVVAGLLSRFDALMAEAAAVSVAGLTDDETILFATGLVSGSDRIDAITSSVFADGHTALVASRAGHRTPENLIAAMLPINVNKLRPKRLVGRWLIDFPVLAHAHATGELTTAQIQVIHEAHNPRAHHAMVDFQHGFIRHGDGLTYPEFKQAVANWLLIADADGPTPSEQELASRYGVNITPKPNGDVEIRGLLNPVAGKAVTTAIESGAQALWQAHNDECEQAMPWRVLRAVAFVNLIATGYSSSTKSARPLINIVISLAILEALLAQQAAKAIAETVTGADPPEVPHPVALIDPWNRRNPDGRCETSTGQPIHPNYLLPLLAVADMRLHVADAAGKMRAVSKDQRFFTKWQAQALQLATRGLCAVPGCTAPIHWLQADHIKPRSKGGPTTLENGQPLCAPHNQWKSDVEGR